MPTNRYLVDSNVFIEAHRKYYAFDLCPGFWNCLVWHNTQGNVWSLDKVREEIIHEGDTLAGWANSTMPASGFSPSNDATVISWYAEIQTWANSQSQFIPAAKAEFAAVADAWLVAYAKTHNLTLVTHEVYAADAKKRIPIPNVCRAFDVEWIDTFTMLKNLSVQFTWSNPA